MKKRFFLFSFLFVAILLFGFKSETEQVVYMDSYNGIHMGDSYKSVIKVMNLLKPEPFYKQIVKYDLGFFSYHLHIKKHPRTHSPTEREETYLYYRDLGVEFTFKTNKKLGNIKFTYPFSGKTDKGIRVGDSKEDVIKAYGKPNNEGDNYVAYNTNNAKPELSFAFDKANRVIEISIE